MSQIEYLYTKTEFTQSDIELLLQAEAEEHLHLEFKAAGSLEKTDAKKNEIARDVSAMANADGGLLIYGISENGTHHAQSLSFVDGDQISKEWLENVIQSKIFRHIPGLIIAPIRFDGDIQKSVYVVKIPPSTHGPHMTSEGKYYKRMNFKVHTMEEYEVREAYFRKGHPELIIDELLVREGGSSTFGANLNGADYSVGFQVRNIGSLAAEHYKLEIHVPVMYSKARDPLSEFKIRSEAGCHIYSVPNKSPLFPKEVTTVGTIELSFGAHMEFDTPIKTKLYGNTDVIERSFELSDYLFHKGQPLKEAFEPFRRVTH